MKLDAIPDLSDPQVIVFTEWMGRSPTLVEDQVTYPIVSKLIGTPHVTDVRGFSMFGMSFVYVDLRGGDRHLLGAQPRARVHERPARRAARGRDARRSAPTRPASAGCSSTRSTDKTGKHGLDELRTFQDFTLRYALGSVPGVAEVASVGGYQKQYQVTVDPNRLRAYGVTLDEVIDAIRQSNNDVGGRIIEISGREYYVRGRGYIKDLGVHREDRARARAAPSGTPLLVKDVGDGALRPRHPARPARVERRGRGGRRHRGHALRRERARRHRAREEEARRAQAQLPRGRRADDRLRPLGPDRALDRHAQARADRGGDRRQPRDHAVPAPLPQLAAADPVAADQRRAVVHPDGAARHPVDDHEPGRHRHRHRRHRRRRDRDDRGRRTRSSSTRRPGADRHTPADRGGQGGHAGDLLLAADHRGRVPAGLHADRPGRAPVQAARLHEDVRHADLGAAVDHVRAGAAGPVHPRQDQAREEAPGLALPDPPLRAVRLRRAPAAEVDDRDRPVRAGLGGPARAAPRQRVHAAAQRGRPALHADHLPEHLDRGGEAAAPVPGPRSCAASPRSRRVFGKVGRAETRDRSRRRSRWSRRPCSCGPPSEWRKTHHERWYSGWAPGLAQAGVAAALARGAAR